MLLAHIKQNFRSSFYPRLSEWGNGLIIFSWGLILANNEGLMLRNEAFGNMLSIASQEVWASICFWLGGIRLIVLFINGAWRRSPHLRGIIAFLCLFIWFQIVLSFSTTFGTGMGTYPVLLIMELINVLRSFQDARLVDDVYRGGTDGQRANK